ncbi:MAG: asparagine synthase (glutamine-hydrolyzing) [Gammaproteobacteria bacterium]
MCGLAGFLGFPVPPVEVPPLLGRMAGTLAHRGPDDQGIWVYEPAGVGLAHRRLSIQDLSPLGAQPMRSATGRFVIAYNGEVYNFPALRTELVARGHTFRGGSDTEVMLAAFEEWGLQVAVSRFVGMFAFAVWDQQERCLWLCRDRLGVKPLYVGHVGKNLVFGSELKAIRAIPGFDRTVDRNALALFMRHDYVPCPYSIYTSVQKLPPGVLARFTPTVGGRPTEVRYVYWSVEKAFANPVAVPTDPLAAVDQLDQLLRESIAMRMIADVPLGVLLSGGIDSSAVTGIAQSLCSERVKTFTIGFAEQAFDEARYARDVARHLNTDHTDLYITPKDAREVVPSLGVVYDEPFGDSSQIPTILVSRLARRRVTVALSGDGGDELFYGYSRYATAETVWRRLSSVPPGLRDAVGRLIESVPPALLDATLSRLSSRYSALGARGSPSQRLRRFGTLVRQGDWRQFYRRIVSRWTDNDQIILGGSDVRHLLADPPPWMRALPYADYMMLADIQTYLADDILAKVDRASMSASLELREPLLDHRVVGYALSLPLGLKHRDGQSKWIMRQVAYRYVPEALLNRPKQGFELPLGTWLRGPLRDWAESVLDVRRLEADGYLNPQPVRARWGEHLGGRLDWSGKLWNVLMFQSWLDQESAEVVEAPSGATNWPVALEGARPAAPAVPAGRPVRVLHMIHSIYGGGAERQLLMLVNSWPHPAIELGVFFVAGDPAAITNSAVRVFVSRRSTRHFGFVGSVAKAIDAFDPDIVHIWLPESIAIPAMLVGKLQGRKVILAYRGRMEIVRWLTALELALAVVLVDSVVSNHEVLTAPSYTRSVFRWLFARRRGVVIRNGVEVSLPIGAPLGATDHGPTPKGAPTGIPAFRFVCAGRLNDLKNYPRLIDALSRLGGRKDWTLDIWGEGEHRPVVEAAIARSGLAARIRLRGYAAEVQREIARASALILPSVSEGMPNVLVEAMALGIPVIAADIEGIREVIGNEPACVWVNPLDPGDIARGIEAFMDGKFDIDEFVQRGRRIAGRFSVAAAQAAYQDLYHELICAR